MTWHRFIGTIIGLGLLAACSSAPQTRHEGDPSSLIYPVSPGTTTWSHTQGFAVELVGAGMGSDGSVVNPQTVTISDPASVKRLIAQVELKGGGQEGEEQGDYPVPTNVRLELICGASVTAVDLSAPSYTTAFGWHYEHDFGSLSCTGPLSLRAEVTPTSEPDKYYSPRALIAAVFRPASASNPPSSGIKPFADLWWGAKLTVGQNRDAYTTTLPIPTAPGPRDVTVSYAIADLSGLTTSEGVKRTAVVEASAGGVSGSVTHDTPNRGSELLISSLVLSNVPGSASSVSVTIRSPDGDPNKPLHLTGGDSIMVSDIVASSGAPRTPGDQGCTPGYWKQEQHFDSWAGYSPGDKFDAVFGRDATNPDLTLLQALQQGGGGLKALMRHAVAALLNASNPGVNYPYTTAQVISMFQAAFDSGSYEATKNRLEAANELGCPLN